MPFVATLDRAIYALFPSWGARRLQVRQARELSAKYFTKLSRQYEGADSEGPRGGKWMTQRLSPDSALEQDLDTLRMRAEELFKNDPYISSYVRGRVAQEIGCGIRPQARIMELAGVIDRATADAANAKLELLFARWARYAGKGSAKSFFVIQRLVDKDLARCGEAFVVMSDRGRTDKPVPLTLEVIHPSRVETPPEQAENGRVRLGVQKDADGEIEGYWVRAADPGDTLDHAAAHTFVPAYGGPLSHDKASGLRMLHVFEPDFAGQSRGVTDLAPVLPIARDLKDFREATIVAAQVSACHVGFVTTPSPLAAAEAAASETDANGNRMQDMRPGTFVYGRPGQSVNFNTPQQHSSYGMFMEWGLRTLAAGLSWTYELIARDYSKTTYSSGRLAMLDARQSVSCRQLLVIEQLCMPVWERFVLEAMIVGELDVDEGEYFANAWHFNRSAWIPPKMPWIDPPKEIAAAIEAVDAGLETVSTVLKSQGLDPEEHFAQLMREDELRVKRRKHLQELEKAAGLSPDPEEEDQQEETEETEKDQDVKEEAPA